MAWPNEAPRESGAARRSGDEDWVEAIKLTMVLPKGAVSSANVPQTVENQCR
jgi:hypothetical protein